MLGNQLKQNHYICYSRDYQVKKMMKRVRVAILISLLFASCVGRNVMRDLSDIESYIDAHPDSALVAIRQIDTLSLKTKAQKARYALLHAMALDKSYIDTSNTSIIMPAVDYYSKHGNPEEKLKAWMYLGTEQFNDKKYNEAIVSFEQAIEYSNSVSDQNLQGVLYSKMADTFIKSQDYVQADDYLDKAIKCFEDSVRPDQKNLAQIMKAVNYIRLMEWDKAEGLFNSLLSDNTLLDKQKGSVEGYYAMMILYNPSIKDTTAFSHLNNAIFYNGTLENVDQYCAYAYILGSLGRDEEADLLFQGIDLEDYTNNYSYEYWKHRLYKEKGDYKKAYSSLLSARNIVDSITRVNHTLSASNAQRVQLEDLAIQRQLTVQNQRWMIVAISLLAILIATVLSVLYLRRKRKSIAEHDRMEIVIDTLNHRISEMNSEKNVLIKEKTKVRFALIGSIFEDIHHLIGSGESPTKERLYEIINVRTKILENDENAQKEFEKSLNEESGNIMTNFHNDFPDLKPEEYRLASCIFAGFDNTTIMLIMGITTLEYTRVKKNRLKNKIQKRPSELLDIYLGYF